MSKPWSNNPRSTVPSSSSGGANSSSDVHFYHQNKPPYGCFSNFYSAEIVLDDKTWPTTEHYFQAMKFSSDPALMERVRTAGTPSEAAALGRKRSLPFRQDWDRSFVGVNGRTTSAKLQVMRAALRAKFDQHPALRQILLSTRGRKLVEHTANDCYWGDGGDGSGKNMLGTLLMELRDVLTEEDEAKAEEMKKAATERPKRENKATLDSDHIPRKRVSSLSRSPPSC